MSTCAWGTCTAEPGPRGVCNRHRLRTFAAGRRAARGTSRERVLAAIVEADRPPPAERVTVAGRLDDLEWLLETGEHRTRAAHRCGWTIPAAARAAHRYGRYRTAHDLTREEHAA